MMTIMMKIIIIIKLMATVLMMNHVDDHGFDQGTDHIDDEDETFQIKIPRD